MIEASMILRRPTPEDASALRRLAELDSALPLDGPVLLAEIDGELRAARSLTDGRTISDPFRPAAAAREMLAVHARQIALAETGRAGRGRWLPTRPRHLHAAL